MACPGSNDTTPAAAAKKVRFRKCISTSNRYQVYALKGAMGRASVLQELAMNLSREVSAGLFLELCIEPEHRTFAQLAICSYFAVHLMDQRFGDRKSKPGSTVLASAGAVRLGEWRKELLERLGSDPDPFILDLKSDLHRGFVVT